uniref:Pimeloyl-ACP methyl ester carboxylesterase n=1 Tax=Candidatus Kentrum sp. DK TaxID=2126562 RepID=A0A450TMC3_9GAMM|nr:MAG: Pimeloyl-ACP methyl ester carboxylesterase [Candidatus Kentron sp. DK]
MSFEDKFITLDDGRALAYTEHGDPAGKPMFFFHGNPGSRLIRPADEGIAERLGVRIITPDRPGYGLSDFQPGRRLLDYPRDITQLADALGLERFAVFGVSAGGMYVAVCAHSIPERLTGAAIVSGAAPFDRDNPYEGMGQAWKRAFRLCKLPTPLLRPIIALQAYLQKRYPEKTFDNMAAMFSKADAEIIRKPSVRAGFFRNLPEAARKGTRGWTREVRIVVSPWGFRPEDIHFPVHLWYWADDPAIPPPMGRYLESRIPNTIGHFLPGGGHLSITEYWEEIIKGLLG